MCHQQRGCTGGDAVVIAERMGAVRWIVAFFCALVVESVSERREGSWTMGSQWGAVVLLRFGMMVCLLWRDDPAGC